MALPDIRATLTAKTDGFEAALERSAKAAEQSSSRIKDSTDKINGAFTALKGLAAGLGAVLTVDAFVGMIKGAIDSADHLNDLSKKTGIAVETLGGLGFAAEQSGSNLDAASSGFVKLEKSIAQAGAGNKEASASFAAVGVSLRDAAGNAKSTDKVFLELADKFASFEDGPNKAALAIALFGKAGADLIPLLNEGGKAIQANVEYYKRYSGVTEDLAKQADQFNDTMAKLGLLQGALGKTIASELLPTLQTLANLFVETKEKGTALQTVAEGIGVVFNKLVGFAADVVFVFKSVGTEIGGIAAQMNALVHLDFKGFSAIGDAMKKDADTARKELDRFKFDLNNAASQNKATLSGGTFDQEGSSKISTGKTEAPVVKVPKTGGRAAKVEDTAKKILDQQLKELDIYIQREKELLNERNTFLQLDYQRDKLSITDYFAERSAARDEDLAHTREALQREIELQKQYNDTKASSKDPRDKAKAIEGGTKLLDLEEKLRKTEHAATIDRLKDGIASEDALERYGDKIKQLEAQILAFSGRTADAFSIDFEARNRSLKAQLTTTATSGTSTPEQKAEAEHALRMIGMIEKQGLVDARINDTLEKRSVILGGLQNAQDRINIAVQSGAKTELEGLQKLSEANAARLPELQRIVEAYEKIAAESKKPIDIVRADQARVELERLAAQTDLIGDKFREIGKSATENFIDKLASGTVTLKDAFKGLFSDIHKDLLKLGSKEISQSLFKKDGLLGGMIGKATDASKKKSGEQQGGSDLADPSSDDTLGKSLRLLGISRSGSSGSGRLSEAATATSGAGAATTAAANDAAFTALSASVGAADSAFATLTATVSPLEGSLTTLATVVDAASSALESLTGGAGGTESGIGDLLGGGGGGDDSSGFDFSGLLTNGLSSLLDDSDSAGGLFGGGSSSGSGLAGLTKAVDRLVKTMDDLRRGADHAAQSLNNVNSSGGSSGYSSWSSLFGGSDSGYSSADYANYDWLASANGNVFSGGNVLPFARGGVVSSPVIFPMARGGVGLMGEAGPEAIIPLRPTDRPYRDKRGKLRIDDGGQGGTTIIQNVNVQAAQTRDLRTASQHGGEIARQLGMR